MSEQIDRVNELIYKINNSEDYYEVSSSQQELESIRKKCAHDFEKISGGQKCKRCLKEYFKMSKSKL